MWLWIEFLKGLKS